MKFVNRGRPLATGLLLPPTSVAIEQTSFSFILNPGAFVQGSSALGYLHEDGTKALANARRGDGIFIRLGGLRAGDRGGAALGFSQEWIRPAGGGCPAGRPCYARTSLGLSFGAPVASIGFAYRWYTSGESVAIDDLGTLDLGLLLRPSPWVSVGFVAAALNGPKFEGNSLPRVFTLGLGVRPGLPWLTLASDLAMDDRTGWRGSRIEYLAAVDVVNGLNLSAQFAHNLETPTGGKIYAFEVGVRGGFGHGSVALGAGTTIDGGNGGVGGVAAFELTAAKGPSLFETKSRAVTVNFSEQLRGPSILESLVGFGGGLDPYTKLVLRLDQLVEDPGVHTVLFEVRGLSGLSFGRIEELRGRVSALREAGKSVVVWLEDATDADYYFATSTDRIYAAPQALLQVNGIASQKTFLRGLLDILRIEPEFVKIGAYKSAPEQFTDKSPSEASAEETNALLDDQFERYVKAISAARKLTPERVRELLNRGLWISDKAVDVGLIDEVAGGGYALRRPLQKAANRSLSFEKLQPVDEQAKAWGEQPAIGLVEVIGSITSDVPGILGETANAEKVVKQIRSAAKDPAVRAIVVRIDSPGGDVGASELMWQAVSDARKDKPVIASFGDVAASGGYYVGCAAGTIFAEPSTITGSIGVFAGKANLSRLLDTIGVTTATFKRGDHADFFTLTRPWTPEERDVVKDMVDTFYETFLDRVAKGRSMTRDEVHTVAQGRVWTGYQAKERGLVDRLGGLHEALLEARRQAGLPNNARVIVMGAKGLFDLPELPAKVETLESGGRERRWLEALSALRLLLGGTVEERSLVQSWPVLQALMEGRPLALATDLPLVR